MTTKTEWIAWLASQVGTKENPAGSNHTPYARIAGHADRQPWCLTFQVAGAKVTGLRLPPGVAETAYTPAAEAAFKRAGRLFTTPQVGDWAFIYFPSLGRVAHVGGVWQLAGDDVRLIEGNTDSAGGRTGGQVMKKVRAARRETGAVGIRSYGRPYYDATPSRPIPPIVPEDVMTPAQEAKLDRALQLLEGLPVALLTAPIGNLATPEQHDHETLQNAIASARRDSEGVGRQVAALRQEIAGLAAAKGLDVDGLTARILDGAAARLAR